MKTNRRNLLMSLPVIAGGTIALASCSPQKENNNVANNNSSDGGGDSENLPENVPEVQSQEIDGITYTMMPEFLSIGGGQATENKVRIYSDMSCPHCKALDEEISEDLQRLILDEQLVAEFVIVNYLGEYSENSWSAQAANLLGAVAESQPDKFLTVKTELYKNQPEEAGEYLAEYLRDMIGDVIELSDEEIKKIDEYYYTDWVNEVVNPFAAANLVSSIPTVVWNDTLLENYGEIVDELGNL